ncbi:CRISPR/Cas system CSM-associated protein Csm3 (group 7 of RAMP superfamily) [Arcicella aurantiaca]|uniref:CRISPR/Cas system CSM-associated protein Csm3 (Group 7 of RAMP superfamily) n=1 Tax=Arcicella aurantiaca TaxID=591202 RepID=A0A316E281_9BACT|nr:RAMP superfamily CRISPR-associated protein [Arcicella aurantiaca]PWK16970.1 CRISPR/Cas system CSM-associated protein Csm3 (group 7 of RAMP superfamily) [Arcicella aurantiaca]
MELTYKITFLSDWHCGSGLSGGAEADAMVIKDDRNLPYVAGKTIKGLLKEALEDMTEVNQCTKDDINAIFGIKAYDKNDKKAFFSNATLSDAEKKDITPALSDFLYRNIASTQIEKNGTAKPNSLRVMEVCIPITLVGTISGINLETQKDLLIKALKWVRHLGVNRNRGLGRCKFEITPKSN